MAFFPGHAGWKAHTTLTSTSPCKDPRFSSPERFPVPNTFAILLAAFHVTVQCVRYLEFIEGQPPKGCNPLLVQALLYTCNVSMGLEMKASRRLETLREAFNDEYAAGRM